MADMERTHVLDVFHHDEAAVRQGLQMYVGQFDGSDQERARIGTKQLIVIGADDHSKLPDLQTSGDWIRGQLHYAALPVEVVGGDGRLVC